MTKRQPEKDTWRHLLMTWHSPMQWQRENHLNNPYCTKAKALSPRSRGGHNAAYSHLDFEGRRSQRKKLEFHFENPEYNQNDKENVKDNLVSAMQ